MISRLILLSFFYQFCVVNSQSKKTINTVLESSAPTIEKLQHVDSIITLYNFQNRHELLDSLYTDYSTWLYKKRKYSEAITIFKASIKNQRNLTTIDTLIWQHRLYYLGLSYRKSKQYYKSISTFEHPIISHLLNKKTAKSYSELGRCYFAIGDYYKAIKHYELGASLLEKQKNNKSLLINYFNTTQAYKSLKTSYGYKKSLELFLKVDSLSSLVPTNDSSKYNIKLGLGNAYNQTSTLDILKSSNYYKEALAIAMQANDSSKMFKVYNELGNLHNTTDPDTGIRYLKKAERYIQKDTLFSFLNNYDLGICYQLKGNYDQSITNYRIGVSHATGIDHDQLDSKWNTTLFCNVKYKTSLLSLLKNLAYTYYKKHKVEKNCRVLKKSIETFRLVDQLIDLIRIESKEYQSKLFWRKQSSEIYGKALEACYLAGDVPQAFFFMEKNKALLLTEDLKNQQLQQTEVLPDSIVSQEITLKKTIHFLKNLVHKNKDSINIVLLKTERRLQNLQDSLSKYYQLYRTTPSESSILSLSDLQNSLDSDTAVLMYNIGQYDDYSKITSENDYTPIIPDCAYGVKKYYPAYGLLITKMEAQFFKLEKAEDLKIAVEKLITQMKTPFTTAKDMETYKKDAYSLYQKLLPTTLLNVNIEDKKLRIIPDNFLHYIPFEALIISDKKNSNYWIEQNEISYAYSNTFLNSLKKPLNNETLSFAGFAPVTFEDTSLLPLHHSSTELQKTEDYFEVINYTHEGATKEQFLETLPQTDIIHLATHADAQDSIAPWIAFRKEKLLQDELALTHTNARLIVLSGCNTLLGKQETGEGVMSLARGFFHSGAQSVVSSLWTVDDLAASELMTSFYNNLSKGHYKSAAIRNAKLHYLENHNIAEASPYYWASFVLLGDTVPLTNSTDVYWWWVVLLLLVVLILWRIFKN